MLEFCPRCKVELVENALFCHACGISLEQAVSGEHESYNVERLFNYALDMLCIAGTDGYFKRINPAFERVLGYTTQELLERPFVELIHPDDQLETRGEVGRLASGKPTLRFQNRYLRKDGTYIGLQWTCYPEPSTGLLYAVARQTDPNNDLEGS